MTARPPIRVLVVDDSAFARKVVREILGRAAFDVVGIARDGLEALEKIAELRPHVVTLDLQMPHLDGLGVLRSLPVQGVAPRVVVVTASQTESEVALEALLAGAIDVVQKPSSLPTERLYGMEKELVAKVQAAAMAGDGARREATRVGGPGNLAGATRAPVAGAAADSSRGAPVELVAIGASTGGPQALRRILAELPADLSAAVAIVVHLPAGYTSAFAERLDEVATLDVVEAEEGLVLKPGLAVVARAGVHLRVEAGTKAIRARLDILPLDTPHRPAVDVLFASAARALGPGVLGIVLTGMGDDGVAGARAIRTAGGSILVESGPSCVVHGMPRAVRDAGLADAEVHLHDVAAEIRRRCEPA